MSTTTVKLPPDKVVGDFGNFRECIASGKNNRFSKFFQHWMRLIIIGGSLLMRSLVCQNCSYQKFVQHSNTPSKAKILNFKISNISIFFFWNFRSDFPWIIFPYLFRSILQWIQDGMNIDSLIDCQKCIRHLHRILSKFRFLFYIPILTWMILSYCRHWLLK